MKLQILGSSSKGNCYLLHGSKSILMLECGVHIKEIKKALNFNLTNVCGCLCTHEHKDHSKSARDMLSNGIDFYASKGTIDGIKVQGHRVNIVKAEKQFKIDEFLILPFETKHDAIEPSGFLIQDTNTKEKLLFATDTFYIKYKFKGLNYIMVECNYIKEILDENIELGLIPQSLQIRLLKSHFSLDNVKEFLKANDLSKARKIILLHLSDGNSDAERMKSEVEELTGIETVIAEKGTVELELFPF